MAERQANFDEQTRAWESQIQQMRDQLLVAQKTQTRARKNVKTAAMLERLAEGGLATAVAGRQSPRQQAGGAGRLGGLGGVAGLAQQLAAQRVAALNR